MLNSFDLDGTRFSGVFEVADYDFEIQLAIGYLNQPQVPCSIQINSIFVFSSATFETPFTIYKFNLKFRVNRRWQKDGSNARHS